MGEPTTPPEPATPPMVSEGPSVRTEGGQEASDRSTKALSLTDLADEYKNSPVMGASKSPQHSLSFSSTPDKDARRIKEAASFSRGQRVMSRVAAPDWTPRPLAIGDEGTVLGVLDDGFLDVLFDADPHLKGKFDPRQLVKVSTDSTIVIEGAGDERANGTYVKSEGKIGDRPVYQHESLSQMRI